MINNGSHDKSSMPGSSNFYKYTNGQDSSEQNTAFESSQMNANNL